MRNLTDHLAKYAEYHRDPRNIALHFVGIPLIVLAVAVLLARPAFTGPYGLTLSPLWLVIAASAVFYLRLDLHLGLTMTALPSASISSMVLSFSLRRMPVINSSSSVSSTTVSKFSAIFASGLTIASSK